MSPRRLDMCVITTSTVGVYSNTTKWTLDLVTFQLLSGWEECRQDVELTGSKPIINI